MRWSCCVLGVNDVFGQALVTATLPSRSRWELQYNYADVNYAMPSTVNQIMIGSWESSLYICMQRDENINIHHILCLLQLNRGVNRQYLNKLWECWVWMKQLMQCCGNVCYGLILQFAFPIMWLSQSAAAITIGAETNIIRQPHCETALLRSFTD